MLTLPYPERNGIVLTHEEHKVILQACREALAAATAVGRLGGPLPVRWRRGWRYTWKPLRRDSDGSVRVSIRCTGPDLTQPYVRNVRLVKERRLNQNFS